MITIMFNEALQCLVRSEFEVVPVGPGLVRGRILELSAPLSPNRRPLLWVGMAHCQMPEGTRYHGAVQCTDRARRSCKLTEKPEDCSHKQKPPR